MNSPPKIMQKIEDPVSVSKRSLKTSHNNTTRKVADVAKRIDNVEYMLKIEDKNKKQLIERYEKQIQKTERIIDKLEKELKLIIKELNEKEAKIYEIQKVKFDSFKEDISKYEHIYLELEAKHKDLILQISELKVKERINYNHSNMMSEDCDSFRLEIALIKKKISDFKEVLVEIEKSYPKEFEFLLEDIKLEKELIEIKQQKKQTVQELEKIEKNKVQIKKELDDKSLEKKNLEQEIEKLNTTIEHLKKDEHLKKLEDYITKNVNDILVFDKFKSIIANYYNQKNFDLEHEINMRLMNDLNTKLLEMKNEFLEIHNEKVLLRSRYEKQIEDYNKSLKLINLGSNERIKIESEISTSQKQLDQVTCEISFLELNCKKKETYFNKYIILLKNRCKKSREESYYDMNPGLIIEVDFEDKFKEELMRIIEEDNNFSQEDKIKNKNLVDIYFKELCNREKLLQNSLSNKSKLLEDNEFLTHEIDKLQETIDLLNTEGTQKKQINNESIIKEKVMLERIEIRNMSLSSNLEKLGEIEFENYLKANDNVLKNMKKIYGNKVLEKVFKMQKQKFLENVILDHTLKKNKVNEYFCLIKSQEALLFFYNNKLISVEEESKQFNKRYLDIIEYKENKIKDSEIIEESKKDLKSKIEEIVNQQFKEIEADKKQLEYKFNLSYYFEKIKEINFKLEINVKSRNEYQEEYSKFKNIIDEKEHKLYLEDIDLKNNLISIQSGVKDPSGKAHLPFRQGNSMKTNDKYILNEEGEISNKEEEEEENDKREELLLNNLQSYEEVNKNAVDVLVNGNNSAINNEENTNGTAESSKSNKIKKDPIITLAVEKMKPLIEGINIYKRYNNISISKLKQFDPTNVAMIPPESCGYSIRNFKINQIEEVIEIKNLKTKIIEQKVNINTLKSIVLTSSAKQIIKNKKSLTKKPNSEIEKLVQNDYIAFTIIYTEGSMEVIAPNFALFSTFQAAFEEIIKHRKNIFAYLKQNDK